MSPIDGVEKHLEKVLNLGTDARCPPQLASALRYAVFPGGGRVRPNLCLAAVRACGGALDEAAISAATAIELMHCASLVHDDLPCFDDADVRRGKPTVHVAYDDCTAVLVGDTLIVMAFDTLADGMIARSKSQLVSAVRILSRASGVPDGIAAGQAWEMEPHADVTAYHDAKTGALFGAATGLGAVVAGHEPAAWLDFGRRVGRAYQAIDDIRDLGASDQDFGKPAGQDERLGRPNIAFERGLDGAHRLAADLIDQALAAIPDCPARAEFHCKIAEQFQHFCKTVGFDPPLARADLKVSGRAQVCR